MTRKLLSTLLLHTDDAALYDTFLTILKEDGRLSDRFWQLFDGVAHVRTQSLLSQWDAERDKVVKVGSFESEKSSTPPEPQSENEGAKSHWLYYVVRCCESSETRGSNQQGNPCSEWGILRRRKPVDWTRPQVRCPQKNCSHRFRVNPTTAHGPYASKSDAEEELERRTAEERLKLQQKARETAEIFPRPNDPVMSWNPDDRKHYVYLCEPTPRQNYHVRAVKKGCGFYQVLSTRRTESTSKSPWMAVCPRCGKRSRMDLRTKHRYLTRDAAMAAAEERNQEESDATG